MLNNQAEQLIQQYLFGFSQSMGVRNPARQFSLDNPKETRLRQALLHSSEFLNLIGCHDVDQLEGQVVITGVSQLLTGRKTSGRFTKKLGVDGNRYKLVETDSCGAISWDLLSIWANSSGEGEFFRLVQEFITKSFALDMLRIGFNGRSVAPDTDPDKYPNGEDINKGWHQIAKDWNGGKQVITSKVTLGDNGDYRTLDSMGNDLVNSLPVECRNNTDIVILVGSDLLATEQNRLYDKAGTPVEHAAAQQLGTFIAGKKAFVPPFMPGKRMVATTLKNLHIYTQKGTRKRSAEDVQDRKQFEDKYWRNEGYALEVPELYAAIDENALEIADDKAAKA